MVAARWGGWLEAGLEGPWVWLRDTGFLLRAVGLLPCLSRGSIWSGGQLSDFSGCHVGSRLGGQLEAVVIIWGENDGGRTTAVGGGGAEKVGMGHRRPGTKGLIQCVAGMSVAESSTLATKP